MSERLGSQVDSSPVRGREAPCAPGPNLPRGCEVHKHIEVLIDHTPMFDSR